MKKRLGLLLINIDKSNYKFELIIFNKNLKDKRVSQFLYFY